MANVMWGLAIGALLLMTGTLSQNSLSSPSVRQLQSGGSGFLCPWNSWGFKGCTLVLEEPPWNIWPGAGPACRASGLQAPWLTQDDGSCQKWPAGNLG